MPATSNYVMGKGKNTSTALTKKRFVKLDTAATDGETVKQCDTLGEAVYGVSLFSVSAAELAKNKGASVLSSGRLVVEAGAAVAIGAAVMTDASGRAITATTGKFVVGMCDEPATGSGNECSVDTSKGGYILP